jgi:hypothetical protein
MGEIADKIVNDTNHCTGLVEDHFESVYCWSKTKDEEYKYLVNDIRVLRCAQIALYRTASPTSDLDVDTVSERLSLSTKDWYSNKVEHSRPLTIEDNEAYLHDIAEARSDFHLAREEHLDDEDKFEDV